MKRLQLLLLWITCIFLVQACQQNGAKKQDEIQALRLQIDSLQNSMDIAWDTMIAEDDKKLDYMKRMMQEAVYVVKADESRVELLSGEIEALRKFRYNRVTMNNSDLIDDYDNATDSTLRKVMAFMATIEGANEVPLVMELEDDIFKFDQMVLKRRVVFDDAAIKLNIIIENQSKDLEALGAPYNSLEKQALFMLSDS
jgi:hypothetical protein